MKILKYAVLIGLVLSVLGFFLGCTANYPYRTFLPAQYFPGPHTNRPTDLPAIDPVTNAVVETHTIPYLDPATETPTNTAYKIGFVEFDDQGWFWAHQQWSVIKDELKTVAKNSPEGVTVLVFVHGWKNNADYDNPNVHLFESVLTNLSTNLVPRKIFGIYVGWRGESISAPILDDLTFYHRKAVAERIGHQGGATQVFSELELYQEWFNTNRTTNTQRMELIVIGHSFGGQLLFSATSQILTERLAEHILTGTEAGSNPPIKSLGDLVILLNPAFEASLYNNIISLATSDEIKYPTNQTPVLAIFTSKSDDATGIAFPAGRFLDTWYESTRPSSGDKERWLFNEPKKTTANERDAILYTVGHDDDYLSYDLNYVRLPNAPAEPANPGTSNKVSKKYHWAESRRMDSTNGLNLTNSNMASRISRRRELAESIQLLQNKLVENNRRNERADLKPYVFTYSDGSTNYECVLQPRTNSTARYAFKQGNPFLNVAVDPKIMDGHSDIANPVFLTFLRDFILFTRTNFPNNALNTLPKPR